MTDLQEKLVTERRSRGMILPETGLSFDDVLLLPQRGVLTKRAEADISTYLAKDLKLYVPIISAPMQSVTEDAMATAMWDADAYGITHRFQSPMDQAKYFLREAEKGVRCTAGAALGVNEGYERYDTLYDSGCRVFCIDIAHAHHTVVKSFVAGMSRYGDEILIAGNVATSEGTHFLLNLEVDAIKVGIGPGAACTTREVTGFGVPQLTAIMNVFDVVNRVNPEVRIIADGGIRTSGDIVKALAAGADTVMLGRLLAGANESPHPGLYWGMASRRVNSHRAPEGVEGAVPRTGPVEDTLKQLAWGIKSGISYSGGRNLNELREKARFVRVTPQSMAESGHRL
jgi:IMP dehydrogenase